ncbi:hypothetical protein [Dechloromonas denitrificans]|uniref:hypothetical protein n=1 Tax=Dechloromonas denitrificans TaxID=281362 RepID=UPI001CFACF47|nr:hypothetical protein [Dechloromonas denitrificans]UCV07564.1 hypothetical protein KI615_19610 [Dechloromonas denitrificans]
MNCRFSKKPLVLAVATVLGGLTMIAAPQVAFAAKAAGTYATGDFHNHTTCSDGSISMQKLVKKVTDKVDTPWGLDWFVQAGHGGTGNRNCTLVEDDTLSTDAYPFVSGTGPTTTWTASIGAGAIKGNNGASSGNMWRWQSIQEFQYPLIEYLATVKNLPLFIGMESVVAGHEHTSMSVITGQMPDALDFASMPTTPGGQTFASAVGNATALAQWSYCFDRGDTDTSRGAGNNWNCSVTGSANAGDANWNATAQKLTGNNGNAGHMKTVEALKWMKEFHPNASYYVPAHLERAGPFNPNGSNGFNIEHLRNFNNAAPKTAFGFETQPGHGASANRGEYQVNRNTFDGVKVDSVGGTTYGGTGVYGAQVGGVWDALLGEGRNWWFFASSDWHNRGSFGPDDRRSTQDFYPGEYQRTAVMVRHGADKLRPQTIVDGLRTGNAYSASGQLIDRMAFVACASYPGVGNRTNSAVETLAKDAVLDNTDIDVAGCATMGEKLKVRPGAEIVVAIVVRDPDGSNYSPYTFSNPSLKQIGIDQPLNKPVLDHVDVIRGLVTGYKTPGAADYSGEWPRNTNWLKTDGTTADLSAVPAAAKNLSAAIMKTFDKGAWATVQGHPEYKSMVFRIPAVQASQYIRLRGTNLPAAVPFETDASGNPLSDLYTNAGDRSKLSIPCTAVHSTGNQFDGCPDHLVTATTGSPIAGQKAVSYDVAAWSDLWFYSNPIYVEVTGKTVVAGVK